MAKIIYDIYRNVKSGSVSEGRYFGRVLQTETLNTAKLARHIAEHGSPYTQDVVEGVLRKAESCILELILDSKKIKIDGLGTFYITGREPEARHHQHRQVQPQDLVQGPPHPLPARPGHRSQPQQPQRPQPGILHLGRRPQARESRGTTRGRITEWTKFTERQQR